MSARLALGTAQFGGVYGIANQSGRVAQDEIGRILALARGHGLNTLDTAIAYGDSELALGQAGVGAWNIVTKLPAMPPGCTDIVGWVQASLRGSLERLRIERVHGLLLHRPAQLLGSEGKMLAQALTDVQDQGLVAKIGVSIYAPEELNQLMGIMPIGIVQAPMNILDSRMIDSGWADRLRASGVELHVRSAFLQGLLLMDEWPAKFARWTDIRNMWMQWLQATGQTPVQACLNYVFSIDQVDQVVIGVDSEWQLREILAAPSDLLPAMPVWPRPLDPVLLNPARWNEL